MMLDLKPTYYSELMKQRIEIKIQINLYEKMIFGPQKCRLKTYLADINDSGLNGLFEKECQEYSKDICLSCYDTREIFVEKCRAVLTRTTYKHRDSLDLFMLGKKYNHQVMVFDDEIEAKTRFALDNYSRYREILESVSLPDPSMIDFDDAHLLLIPKPSGLEERVREIHVGLETIRKRIRAG
jgi:hypothetical protein